MDDYRNYLAQALLTEDKLVTYRLLSRALKVHVNIAKEMLYEFHKWQNDKRPGTLHATYLIYGIRQKSSESDGDVDMADSQSESVSENVPTTTMTLVTEEQLSDTLQQYDDIKSIQVYSLAPHPLKDLQVLAEPGSAVVQMSIEEDLTQTGKVYGMITNPRVYRRIRKGGVPRQASSASVIKTEPNPQVLQEAKPTIKEEKKATETVSMKETKAPVTTTAKKSSAAPSLKRQGSSGGISQMFAKAAAKPKKPASRTTSATPSVADTPSSALSDEGEDDSEMPDVQPDLAAGIARKNRQDELRRMMEESDEETESKPATPVEEPMEEEPPAEPESKADDGPSEVVSSTGNGRKRGRRRITKKKQVMDEDGYLVTIQEQGWESFSEDETPPASKQKVEKTDKIAPPAKKKGSTKGQGNIMSFFSKK